MMKFASETTKPFVDDYLLCTRGTPTPCATAICTSTTRTTTLPRASPACSTRSTKFCKHGFIGRPRRDRARQNASRQPASSACISLETAQNEMHGGQAIPAFDFYLAPFVRSSFVEEVKKHRSHHRSGPSATLYDVQLDDFIKKPLDGPRRARTVRCSTPSTSTVSRVHQAMEAFIHNMNTIHSRGGNQVVFSSINYGTDTIVPKAAASSANSSTPPTKAWATAPQPSSPSRFGKRKRGVNYLQEDPNYDLYRLRVQGDSTPLLPQLREPRRHLQPA